jgi:hypothetical protein
MKTDVDSLALKAEPSNEHQSQIVRIVDGFANEGRLYHSTLNEIIAALDFVMSRSDAEFLVSYLWCRMGGGPIMR